MGSGRNVAVVVKMMLGGGGWMVVWFVGLGGRPPEREKVDWVVGRRG